MDLYSVHRPKHQYPNTDEELGYYLAGLIDSDGSFIYSEISKDKIKSPQLVIVFHQKDAFWAYRLRTIIGYGNVNKILNKKAYIISNKNGFIKIHNLINGKLKIKRKWCKFNRIAEHFGLSKIKFNTDNNLKNNHYLAGFVDGDGSLQIKIIKRKNDRYEVRIVIQIDLQEKDYHIIELIKNNFNGYVGYRKTNNSYYYSSVSFKNLKNWIEYLDKYCLCSNKYKEYVIWRKVYFKRFEINKVREMKLRISELKK